MAATAAVPFLSNASGGRGSIVAIRTDIDTGVGGYELRRTEDVEHLDATYLELVHAPTGARHIHIAAPDPSKAFAVLFPTVPVDSTGVAHILEHCVLAGSERFPVRDPFFAMLPRSLKDFMNAVTFPDATLYPFSTRNLKDFHNLLEVYLDACFFPLLTEEAFRQEGHRLEFTDPEDPSSGLRFKGVVFNEMKGAMASPPSVLRRSIGRAIYPDLTYANNSGGDPGLIPDLTWETLRAFHATHYHPSNAYFFTYGDIDLAEVLSRIEEYALGRFEPNEIDTGIPIQPRFEEPRVLEVAYPVSSDEGVERRSQALVGWATADGAESFEILALRALEKILLDNAGSPLRKALIDSKLGTDLADATGFHTSFREAAFCAGLKGIDADDAERVERLVLTTLERLVADGIEEAKVEAALHQLEITSREVSHDGFPYPLKLLIRVVGPFYREGDPYRSLRLADDLQRLRERAGEGGFFEGLIRRYLLDNPHRVRIDMSPDPELEARQEAEELARLKEIEERLSGEEKERLVADAKLLRVRQESKDDPSVLPKLTLDEVPVEIPEVPHLSEEVGSALVGSFPQPTNGFTYVELRADASTLPERLRDRLGLFAYALTRTGAGTDDYVRMAERIDLYTGGIDARPEARHRADGSSTSQWVVLRGKALSRNDAALFEVLRDLVCGATFEPGRMRDVVAEDRARFESLLVQAGHMFAARLASAKLGEVGALGERFGGLSRLTLLRELADAEDGAMDGLREDLERIREHLFRAPGLSVSVTSTEDRLPALRESIADLLGALPSERVGPAVGVPPADGPRHEARTTSVPVAYNARVVPTVPYTHADAPALMVLGHLLRSVHLHREIREKGGAYGSGARMPGDEERGLFTFSSYRDPNIERTFRVFSDAVRRVVEEPLDPGDIEEAVLSAFGTVDPLLSPDLVGSRRFADDLSGYTREVQERFRRGLLEVGAEDLKRVAEAYLLREDGATAVISGAEKVREANEAMGGVFEVRPV